MVDFKYLELGVAALSRAHYAGPMAGHLGATLVSGYFIGEDRPELSPAVIAGIEAELDRVIAGQSVFSPKGKAATATLFKPLAPGRNGRMEDVVDALSNNIGQLRASGHNVIFAALALRALSDHPDLATNTVVDGLCKLVRAFDTKGPGSGYYGKKRGRVDGRRIDLKPLPAPAYHDIDSMARTVFRELDAKAHRRLDGYGGLWHLINHASALADLERYGFGDVAAKGITAHRNHLRLLRSLPDLEAELGGETPTRHPSEADAFWAPDVLRRERAHLTHRVKTLYGHGSLADWVDEPALLRAARRKLRNLL